MKKMDWLTGIKAIGFDVDGTLYAYNPEVSIRISNLAAEKAAKLLKRDLDEFKEEYLRIKEKYRGNTLTLNSMGLDGEKIYQEVFDNFPLEEIQSKDPMLVKGIEQLAKKYQVFILSNGTERQIVRKLKVLGLDPKMFGPLIACYDRGWVKPEPAPFLAALEELNMKPEEVLYVGDRIDVDVEAAQAVGMKAAYVGGEDENAEVSCVTVGELLEIIN